VTWRVFRTKACPGCAPGQALFFTWGRGDLFAIVFDRCGVYGPRRNNQAQIRCCLRMADSAALQDWR